MHRLLLVLVGGLWLTFSGIASGEHLQSLVVPCDITVTGFGTDMACEAALPSLGSFGMADVVMAPITVHYRPSNWIPCTAEEVAAGSLRCAPQYTPTAWDAICQPSAVTVVSAPAQITAVAQSDRAGARITAINVHHEPSIAGVVRIALVCQY